MWYVQLDTYVVVWVLLWVHSTVPLYNTPSWQLVDFNAVKSSVGIKNFYKIEFTNMQIIKYLVVMWDPKIKEDMPCSLESYFVTKCHKEHSIFQNQCFYKQFHNCKLKMENVIMHCEHCFFIFSLYSFCLVQWTMAPILRSKKKNWKSLF